MNVDITIEAERQKTAPSSRAIWLWGALAAVLALGIALRVAGSMGELWLDELWSLSLVAPLKRATEVFTQIHHDNNHYLVSLWMWFCGGDQAWWVYRVPSVLAGVGATLAAIWIGLRQSDITALIAGWLVSLSYLAVVYSSEARGYAIACCMVLVAYGCLERYLENRDWTSAAGYALAIVFGMLGHLSYISVAVALGLWSMMVLLGRERTFNSALQWVALHAFPVTVLGALWLADVRKMNVGGGPMLGTRQVLCETINYALGLRGNFAFGGVLAITVFVFVAWQLYKLARNKDLKWVFFATALILAPAALLIVTKRAYLYPRYFLVQVFVLYLLIALAAGRAWAMWGRKQRWYLAALLLAWGAANVFMSVELARIGRGHYKEALEYIAVHTPNGHPTIGSTQDFRSAILINYYGKYLPVAEKPQLVPLAFIKRDRPEWILTTVSPYEWASLPQTMIVSSDLQYRLEIEFPSVKISGLPAGVYRRADLSRTGSH